MIYTPRLTKPTKTNKYYITKSKNGYSDAIKGKVKTTGKCDSDCDVLANCVGYAYGRFHEIIGDTTMSYLSPRNAENFPDYMDKNRCKTGKTSKLGSVIVWQKGTLNNEDGAGHVAIVEEIISDTKIKISQSGYNSKPFWTEICEYKNKNWVCPWMNNNYKFRCFIYNPSVNDSTKPLLKNGSLGIFVKELQEKLNKLYNYNLEIDGCFGKNTETAVRDFQKKNKLKSDGIFGENSWNKLNELSTNQKTNKNYISSIIKNVKKYKLGR